MTDQTNLPVVGGVACSEKLLYEVAMGYFPDAVLEREYGLALGTIDRLRKDEPPFNDLVDRQRRRIDEDDDAPALRLRARILAKTALDTCNELMRLEEVPPTQRLKAAQLVLSVARIEKPPEGARVPTLILNTNLNFQERGINGSYTIEARPLAAPIDDDPEDLL